MTDSFLFDKILPFTSKKNNINILNIKQVYQIRFGIGYTISDKINLFSGTQPAIKFENYKENDINMLTKTIFEESIMNLDEILRNKMISTLQENIDTYSYKGYMYLKKLPINGQRRRSKKRTNRRVRPINNK